MKGAVPNNARDMQSRSLVIILSLQFFFSPSFLVFTFKTLSCLFLVFLFYVEVILLNLITWKLGCKVLYFFPPFSLGIKVDSLIKAFALFSLYIPLPR